VSNQVFVTDIDAIRASGTDVGSFLQGQLSQEVVALAVGEACFSLLLAPQGKLDAWLRVVKASESEMLLLVQKGFGAGMVKRLERFKMRVDVTFTEEPFRHYYYPEPQDPSAVTAHHIELGHWAASAWSANGVDAFDAATHPIVPAPTFDIGSVAAARIERLVRGVPEMGPELDENTIPAEAGIVDRSASFTKGCYTGQELVARVDSRGSNTPRKLRCFAGSGSVPGAGAELADEDGQIVATVTSAEATELGWVGLGYVKRSALELTSAQYNDSTVAISTPAHMVVA